MFKAVMEYVRAYGLELHVVPIRNKFAASVTWEHPPINQIMAQGHRAMIAYAEALTPSQAVDALAPNLQKWFEEHKDIERSFTQ